MREQAAQQVRTQFDAAPKYPEVYYQSGTAPMVQYQPQPGQPKSEAKRS